MSGGLSLRVGALPAEAEAACVGQLLSHATARWERLASYVARASLDAEELDAEEGHSVHVFRLALEGSRTRLCSAAFVARVFVCVEMR